MVAVASLAAVASASDFFETESNDTKATSNAFTMTSGDRIIGNSTASTGAGIDSFLVTTATASRGIYRHRLTLESAIAGHTGSIRGLSVTGGVAGTTTGTINATSDVALQTSSTTTTPARFNQWYGFGMGESLYYRVTGVAATTANYAATLESTRITPVNLGTFQPGQLDFTTFDLAKSPNGTGTTYTDTEMTLYDANFSTMAAWNNDDYFPQSSVHPFHSELHLNLLPGTYYIALSQFNLTVPFAADPTHENGPNDSVSDFGNLTMASSSATTHGSPVVPISLDFSITDNLGTRVFDAEKPGAYGVYWGELTVVPEPGSVIALGSGLALILFGRKRKS